MKGLRLSLIHHDDRCQTREALNRDHIEDLTNALDAGESLPPLDVLELPDGALCVVDGFHRLAAYQTFGSTHAPMRVVGAGTLDDARRIALKANSDPRGLKRTTADKRHAVGLALTHIEAPKWSDVRIAELCAVSVDLVRKVRAERDEASETAEARAEATAKAAALVAAKPAASSREVAREAGVSHKAARTAIAAAKAPSVPQEAPSAAADAEPAREAPKPTAAMLAKAAALPAGAPDPLPLLEVLRKMDTLRREIGPLIGNGELYRSSTQDFDQGWDRARACIAFAVPVPCAHHEGPECQWCGGVEWYSTNRSKAVEPQFAAMMSIRGKR